MLSKRIYNVACFESMTKELLPEVPHFPKIARRLR
jgi:hypothetical protein